MLPISQTLLGLRTCVYGPASRRPAACRTPSRNCWTGGWYPRNRKTPLVGQCEWSDFVSTSAFCFSVVSQFLFLSD